MTEYNVRIEQDNDPMHPRKDHDNLGTMVCFHTRYNLGDETHIEHDWFGGWNEMKEFILTPDDKEYSEYLGEGMGAVIALPLSLYDHSGISMSVGVSRGWDCGQVGFIYCTQKDIDAAGMTLEDAERHLRGEVETYNAFISGDIYGFTVEDESGEHIDSCWGFYGYDAAKEAITNIIREN